MMIWLIITILIWGLIHSFLASRGFKSWLNEMIEPQLFRGYRLIYNLFSVISALPIVWLYRNLPDRKLYSVPAPLNFIFVLIQGIALLFLIIGVIQTDALAFVGVKQLFENRAVPLVKNGLYRLVRHPLYSFGLIFLWLTPVSTMNYLILRISFSIYLIAGAYFEERKLLAEFGNEYLKYKQVTPMFIPRIY